MPNVALVDIRHVDGEPWEVATVAGKQTQAAHQLAQEACEAFYWAARGSWMSQEEYRTGSMPDGKTFSDAPLGSRIQTINNEISQALKEARTSTASASWDPRQF